jgi:hypothetical protein
MKSKRFIRHPGEDRLGREGSRVAIRQTRTGRFLQGIYVPDPEPESIFVITAWCQDTFPQVASNLSFT